MESLTGALKEQSSVLIQIMAIRHPKTGIYKIFYPGVIDKEHDGLPVETLLIEGFYPDMLPERLKNDN